MWRIPLNINHYNVGEIVGLCFVNSSFIVRSVIRYQSCRSFNRNQLSVGINKLLSNFNCFSSTVKLQVTVRQFYSLSKTAYQMDPNCEQKVGALSPNDPNSFSNPEDVRAERIKLRWDVDFKKKIISGSATYQLVISKAAVQSIILDTKDINIKAVSHVASGRSLDYSLGKSVLTFGQPLTIKLPPVETNTNRQGEKLEIEIQYDTSPNSCSALQWLEKEQTAGKQFPYLFSQCEPIHARSLLPCQDTPSTKASYSAEVTAQKELQVLMSAVRSEEPKLINGHQRQHKFEQKIPIPSYLIAIVAGNIQSKKIGPRTHVWAETEFLEAAAYDFSETEQMIQAAESLLGDFDVDNGFKVQILLATNSILSSGQTYSDPINDLNRYVWEIYDILVLPPSFPFGGMENPCLTFATPTLLAGDKSLANVIAHEIAHSWTGNLVTNKTFEHFWLNEGFTVFAERKILGLLKGEPYRQFASLGGWKDLDYGVNTMKPENPLTCLVPDLTGVDPDDSFSIVPYEKGYAFLYYLEQKVGGPDVFEPFLKSYIQANRFKSIDTNAFKFQFIQYFTKEGKSNLIQNIDWDGWLYTPGMPLVKPQYDTTLLDVCVDLKNRWVEWDQSNPCPFEHTDMKRLNSTQVEAFLTQLIDVKSDIEIWKLRAMQTAYNLNDIKNSEIRFRWLRLCIKAKWTEQVPLALKFVTEQGRMKYIRPIYRDLYAWEQVRSQAIETFEKNRSSMMYVSAYTVSKDLNLA